RAGDRARGEARRRGDHARCGIDRRRARAADSGARRTDRVSAIAAPADRRFRRAHVKPSRKRGHWRAIVKPIAGYPVLTGVLAYGVQRAAGVAAAAHVVEVDRIVVRGNERLSKGDVLAVLNGLRGENVLWTDLDVWRRRLMASPWVRDAALRRSLP